MFLQRLFYLAISIGLIHSCGTKSETTAISKHVIDIEDSEILDEPISIRNLLEDVDYVRLNTEDFFLTEVKKIKEFNEKIIALDKNKRILVVYDMEGNFIQQIGKKGMGPEEYQEVSDFDIDFQSNSILVYSRSDKAFLEFNEQFEFVRKQRIDKLGNHFSVLESGNLALYQLFESVDGNNIRILDRKGKELYATMTYPVESGNVTGFDYTGFLHGNHFTYPLSSIVYAIDDTHKINKAEYEILFPNQRDEELKFNHTQYLSSQSNRKNIFYDFTIGDNKEVFFCYNKKTPNMLIAPIGLKLSSGQIFSHKNMYYEPYKDGHVFNTLFFYGPYNLPRYSNGFYYITTTPLSMEQFILNKDKHLAELKPLDKELYEMMKDAENRDMVILMRFKLKDRYVE